MLAVTTLQLQCYSPLSSTARYSHQTHLVSIQLDPSSSLTEPEAVSCEQLDGLVYRAYAYVGTYSFVSDAHSFQYNQSLTIELSCQDCTDFSLIERASAVQFEMRFLEHMLEESSAISQFLIEDFNKATFFAGISVKFAEDQYYLEFTQEPSCHNFGKPAQLTFYYNNEQFFSENVSDLCALGQLPASCGTECPLQLFTMLYDDFFRGSVRIVIPYQMGSKNYLEESTSGTISVAAYSPLFAVHFEEEVEKLQPEDEVDCFSSVGAIFYSNAVKLLKQPGAEENCPQADNVQVTIVVSELQDYSGRIAIFRCELANANDEYVSMESDKQLIKEIEGYMQNTSVDISLFYQHNVNLLGLARYQDNMRRALYRHIVVSVSTGHICFSHRDTAEKSTRKTVDLMFYQKPFLDETKQILHLSDSLIHPPESGHTCFYHNHNLTLAQGLWARLRIGGDSFPIDELIFDVEFEPNYYIILIFACSMAIAGGISYLLIWAINNNRFKALAGSALIQ